MMIKLRRVYGFGSKCWDAGYGRVYSRVNGLLTLFLLAMTLLGVYEIELSPIFIVSIFLVGAVILWLVGLAYVKLDLWKAESVSNFKESPYKMEEFNNVKWIRKHMEEYLEAKDK